MGGYSDSSLYLCAYTKISKNGDNFLQLGKILWYLRVSKTAKLKKRYLNHTLDPQIG